MPLKSFTEKTNAGNQQLQYKHSLAERKMAIARTALETIANGETDPGGRELARLPEQVLGVCGPAVFRTAVCMQDHSRLNVGPHYSCTIPSILFQNRHFCG
jgi:hypothetical protein